MILHLSAKTHKAKNRIREHGSLWKVVKEHSDAFLVQPAIRFAPTDNSVVARTYMRWVLKEHDAHFDWEKVTT